MGQDNGNRYVCIGCIGDPILADEVRKNGVAFACSYCGHTCESIDLDSLANRIDEVLQKNFERTPDEPDFLDAILIREGLMDVWLPDGAPVATAISDMAGLSEEIAEDLAVLLSGRFEYLARTEGGENPYDSEIYYEERSPDDWGFHYGWKSFCDEIMYHERIFPENAEPVLEDIFGDPNSLETRDGTPVVRVVNPNDEFPIWRARTAQSKDKLIDILKNPAQELGPPPHNLANAGRMNQKGIPVFYAAQDEGTCIAEVRPPVGSQVVIGKFNILRPIRLLDLGALSNYYVDPSHFDPDYGVLHGRASFIRSLVDEISKPVMPQDADREYLPTQFVASYLARKVVPKFDGIIFPSSQTERGGHNVVLFNHARGVENYELPEGTEVEVHLPYASQEDDSILVSQTTPLDKPKKEDSGEKPKRGPIRLLYDDTPEAPDEDIPATLKLDVESVHVLHIEGVKYNPKKQEVWQHRQTVAERDAFNVPAFHDDLDSLLDVGSQSPTGEQP